MFRVVSLIALLIIVATVLNGEKKRIRLAVLSYFILLSIVFLSGSFYISFAYHLYNGPAVDGGFQRHFEWVSAFSYLFIIPLFLLLIYKCFRFVPSLFEKQWIRTIMLIFWVVILLGLAFISFFVFILLFYGFAP